MRSYGLAIVTCAVVAAFGAVAVSCGGDDTGASGNPDGGGRDAATNDGTMGDASPSDGRPPGDSPADGRSDTATDGPPPPPDGGNVGASVLQHHLHPSRDGAYVEPILTQAAAATMHMDPTFTVATTGVARAQALYVESGPGGKEVVITVTEQNNVYAHDAATGNVVWMQNLGNPAPLNTLQCGNIDPLGITGTPVIDLPGRTIYLDAMIGGGTPEHEIFALSLDDGTTKAGWPVHTGTLMVQGAPLDSTIQSQRAALLLLNGTLYVPYGGYYGDCGNYHGTVVGVPLGNPGGASAWGTTGQGGGIWGAGGLASDGTSIFATTGNTIGTTMGMWVQGEAILRIAPGPTFSGQPADYLAPSNWFPLDQGDVDLGGSGPLVVDVAGATPSALVVALGKDGNMYLGDRNNLGGIGMQVAMAQVASNEIINAAASYKTAMGTYVVFHAQGSACPAGQSGDLVAIRIGAASPPTIDTAWCQNNNGAGSPMVTTTDGTANAIVWSVGAEGDNRLHGFDGDTGNPVFMGGGAGDVMSGGVSRFVTPIAVKGRIFVAGNSGVYAFTH